MAINIKKPDKRIDEATLATFEAEIGQTLPRDYRQFLLDTNGGRPEGNQFEVPDDNTDAGVDVFYGLFGAEKRRDLRYQIELMRERVPQGILPIGDACCGNMVCLSLRPDTAGKVFFWDHELEADDGEPATFANLFKVGDSFQQFLDGLKPFGPDNVESKPGHVGRVWIHPDFDKLVKKAKEEENG
jgi:hypothetical protein